VRIDRTKNRRSLALLLLVGLAGCEATTFEKPPLAETSCDPQLVGDWLTVADPGSSDMPGEGELRIDKSCMLIAIDHKLDKPVTSDTIQLHIGHDGAQKYLWVDSAWAFRFAQSDEPAPAGDVTVLRYDLQGKDLTLNMTDDRAIAHRIIDGDLQGDVHESDGVLLNRLTGKLTPEQLREKVAFSDKPAQFVRREAEAVK
jgi:hypothetical protein